MLARILLALSIIGAPSLAWGQASVLQGGPWLPGHIPQYVGMGSFQPVLQDGGAAGGGPPGANPSEIGITARGTGTPPYAGQGTGPFGTNVCDYDAPITNAIGYHYFCWSANAQGSALIAIGAVGAQSQLPLIVNLNGTAYPFPGPGTGNVLGPNSSTSGDIVLFNNSAGTLLKDSGIQGTALLAGGYTTVNAATYPTVPADQFLCVSYTTTGPVTITLPALGTGPFNLYIKDCGGKASLNNITVASSGGATFDGVVSPAIMNSNFAAFGFRQTASGWSLF